MLQTAAEVASNHWADKVNSGEWSAAELFSHLVSVEQGIVAKSRRVIDKTPRQFPVWQRFHLPMLLVEARVIRLKSPVPVDQVLIGSRDDMLDRLERTREGSLGFLQETRDRDLSAYRWKHPFLGYLDLYEWFEMIAAHELRHTKQLREIAGRLRKVV